MFGDYPSSMRSRVGNRLPKFSPSEAALVKGSLDFVGINHYTTFYARNNSTNVIGTLLHDSIADSGAITLRKFQTEHYQANIYFVIVLYNFCFALPPIK
jgi:beta-glucosidase